MENLKDVREFHETFGHPVANKPILIDIDRVGNRIDWIVSELMELKDAIRAGDIVEQGDALVDAQYFLSGTIIECGMADIFPAMFAEVQRSNMSKACNSFEEAEATIAFHKDLQGDCHYIEKVITDEYNVSRTVYIVIRTGDSKIMKSINYSPANLSFIKDII